MDVANPLEQNVVKLIIFPARKFAKSCHNSTTTFLRTLTVHLHCRIPEEHPLDFSSYKLFCNFSKILPPGGTPYIRMIGMIVVFFRGCNRRFSIFLKVCSSKSFKKIKLVFVTV